jgi:hypothetical protein
MVVAVRVRSRGEQGAYFVFVFVFVLDRRPYPPTVSRFAALSVATRSRSTRWRSLPVGVLGISSGRRKVTLRGTL